jgi:predicted DNA-binding transcriptional regulator AlpA
MKMNGLKDYEIFQQLGISRQTFYKWRREHADFADALKIGQKEAIADAINSLISKFKKSTLREVRTETWVDKNGNEKTHTIEIVKEIAPDTAAIIFFLKAQAGWRDNAEIIDTSDTEKVFEMLKQTQQMAESLPDEQDKVQPETA